MTTNHIVKCIQALLVALLVGLSTSAYSQGTGVMTVETSSTGTIQVRYFIAQTQCLLGGPVTSQAAGVPGGWQITTTLVLGGICLDDPISKPKTLIVDLGNPAPGRYTVTWVFTGGVGYGNRSADFTVTQDGMLALVPAIPTLDPSMIALLALLLATALALGGSWRPWRERLLRGP